MVIKKSAYLNQCSGSTRYFGLSLYGNENDFYNLCTYERRTTYRSLTPSLDEVRISDRTLKASRIPPFIGKECVKVVQQKPTALIITILLLEAKIRCRVDGISKFDLCHQMVHCGSNPASQYTLTSVCQKRSTPQKSRNKGDQIFLQDRIYSRSIRQQPATPDAYLNPSLLGFFCLWSGRNGG